MSPLKRALFFLIVWFSTLASHAKAAEDWHYVDLADIPTAGMVAVFNNTFYVVGPVSNGFTLASTHLMKSTDAVTWSSQNFPTTTLTFLATHSDGSLYLFGDESLAPRIYRSYDGDTWTLVGSFAGFRQIPAAISFNGYMYAAISGQLYRSDGVGSSPTWDPVNIGVAGASVINFQVFKGELYALASKFADSRLLRTSDGVTWTSVWNSTIINSERIAVYDGAMYWEDGGATGNLFKSTGSVSGLFSWTEMPVPEIGDFGNDYGPAVVGDRLHVFSSGTSWLYDDAENIWSDVDSVNTGTTEDLSTAQTGDMVVLANQGRLYRMKIGATNVGSDAYSAGGLSSSQQDAAVLAWSITANLSETMTGLVVTNNGTALATQDITSLKLYRMPGSTLIGTLTADSDGKTWRLPSGTTYEWDDGEANFILAATISSSPTDRRTCDFELTNITWDTNTSYTYTSGAVSALAVQEIRATVLPGVQRVDGVMPYPQPARNSMRFLYDLDEISSVKIEIYDVTQNRVKEISETDKAAGARQFTLWDCSKVAPGLYYALIRIKASSGAERMFKKKVFIER